MRRFAETLRITAAVVWIAMVGLAPLSAKPRSSLETTIRQVAAPPSLDIDHERSVLVARLKRGGLLRFLGHEHGIVPGAWSADVRFDPADVEASSIVVEIDVSSLVIDSDEARRLADVDPDGPGDADVQEIQAKMLSEEQLDAESFPTLRFESTALELRSDEGLRIEGTLTLRGMSRDVAIDAAIERFDDGYRVSGELEIEQREFGIEPVSIGGVVNVANEVAIRFEVFALR